MSRWRSASASRAVPRYSQGRYVPAKPLRIRVVPEHVGDPYGLSAEHERGYGSPRARG